MKQWTIEDLFPECIFPYCPKYGTSHSLECQKDALSSKENYIYWQAGVGASKTIVLATLANFNMLVVPENKGILFRRDYGLNARTVWMRFKASVKIACEKEIIPSAKSKTPLETYTKMFSTSKKDIGATLCTYPNGSIMQAGQTKNLSESMGPEYGFIGVDDAMENDYAVFTGVGTVGGFQSRLRHPQAAYFKVTETSLVPLRSIWPDVEVGQFIDMRKCFLDSNPPEYDHWLWSVFGKVPGVRELSYDELTGKTTYCRFILTESSSNDHLPPGYLAEIASQHEDADERGRILGGKSIAYYPGIRVYKEFKTEKHVAGLEYNPSLPLLVSLDPGRQHPAAICSQISRCAYNYEHFLTLSEVSNLRDVNNWEFMLMEDELYDTNLGVLPHIAFYYPELFDFKGYKQALELLENAEDRSPLEQYFSKCFFCSDKAADKTSPDNKDNRSARKIWLAELGIRTRVKYLSIQNSLNQMSKIFKDNCPCGMPRILINNTCSMLIEAYAGGYRFEKTRSGAHKDKPLNDAKFEDVADAHRYGVENFYLSYKHNIKNEPIVPLIEDYLVLPDSKNLWVEFFKG